MAKDQFGGVDVDEFGGVAVDEESPEKPAPVAPPFESPLQITDQGPIYKSALEAQKYGLLSPSDLSPGQQLRRSQPIEKLLGPTPEEVQGMGGSPGARVGALPVIGATSPMLPVGMGGLAGKALMTYFAADFARQQPEIYRQAKAAADRGDWSEFGKIVGPDAFGAAMTALGLRQVFTPGGTGRPEPNLETMQRVRVPGTLLPETTATTPPVTVAPPEAAPAPEATVAPVPKALPAPAPTVTTTTPPVPAAEMPKTPTATGMRPAIRLVGGEIAVGDAGMTHPEIIARDKISADKIDQRGFVGPDGRFYDREQTAAITGQPTESEADRQHSTDLPEAKPAPAISGEQRVQLKQLGLADKDIADLESGKASVHDVVARKLPTQDRGPDHAKALEEARIQAQADIEQVLAKPAPAAAPPVEPAPVAAVSKAAVPPTPGAQGLVKNIRARLEGGERPGAEAGGGSLHQMLYDFGKAIYQQGMKFADWSARMVKELGEKAKAWLQSVWTRVSDLADFDVRSGPESANKPYVPVQIRGADGKVYPAQFNGYYDLREVGGGLRTSIGREIAPGHWSHGGINEGEKLLTRIPSIDKWKRLLAAEKRREATYIPHEIQAGAGVPPPGGRDPLRELTEAMGKERISPQQPTGERIQQAIDMAGRWARGKDAVTQGMARAYGAAKGLLDSYLHLPAWRDFETAVGRWTGADQRTSREVMQFQKAIKRAVPSKLRQESITNWIQANGDEAVLRDRAAASKPALRRGYEAALTLNDAEKKLAGEISSYLDSRLQQGIAADLLKQGVDNYVTQLWQRPNTATNRMWSDLFGAGKLTPTFKFAKKRIFDNYFEGEQAGYTPRTKAIGDLLSVYDLAFNRALSARAFIKELHGGTAKDGSPVAMVSGSGTPVPKGEEVPEAFLIRPHTRPEGAVTPDGRPYVPVNHWALRGWKWATKTPEGQNIFVQGDMLLHPDYATKVKRMLKTSVLRQVPFTRAILRGAMLAKQTKLSLSPFHTVQEGLHAMAHRVDPTGVVKEMVPIDLEQPEQKALADHGLMISDYNAAELFSEGLSGGGLVGKIPGLGRLQQMYTEMTFQEYIPRLKMTMALDALKRNRAAYAKQLASGKITDNQILALTARESNAAFGEQNYRMMARSATFQDFLRLGLLAPDFLEARARFVGQALKPYGREQRLALALMAATLYVTSRMLNKALDDDEHWDKPFSIIYKGREYHLRTLLGDVQHMLTDPRGFWYNRLSPISRTLSEYVTGRDDRGIKRSSFEQFKDFLGWFKPIPLQTRPGEGLPQTILQSAGVPSRMATEQQQLYQLLDSWRSKQTDPKIKEAYDRQRQETHVQSPYGPLRIALQSGNLKAARTAYDALLASRTPKQIDFAMRPWSGGNVNTKTMEVSPRHPKPFTGSQKTEPAFLNSLNAEQRLTYERAQAERMRLYRSFQKMVSQPKASQKTDEFGGVPVE